MNMISFANFENFDLSGAAPPNAELPEGVEKFSALFTSFALPQPQPQTQRPVSEESTPVDRAGEFTSIQVDLPSIRTDVSRVRPDVSSIQPDVSTFQPDFPPVRPDVQSIQLNAPSLQPDVPSVNLNVPSVQPDASAEIRTNSPLAETVSPVPEADSTLIDPLWRNMILGSEQTKPWQTKFGIDRIATQAREGVIDADAIVKNPVAVPDSTPPNEKLDPTLWAGNTRPETPDYKKHLQDKGPVKPDVIVPGDTPPIIVPPTVPGKDPVRPSILNNRNMSEAKKVRDIPVVIPIIVPPIVPGKDPVRPSILNNRNMSEAKKVREIPVVIPIIVPPTVPGKDPVRPSILNYQNMSEAKKVRDIPVVIPIIVPPIRTSFDGPPLEGVDPIEFPDGPTAVNESGGVLTEFRFDTGGIKPPREPFFPFDGPPLEGVDPIEFPDGPTAVNESGGVLTEFRFETGGIKPPREPFFPFDGPPRENPEVPDVYIQPTGVQTVEDVAFVKKHISGSVRMTPFELIMPQSPKPLLSPRLDAGRIRGFELTPADVQTIAGTLENMIRPDKLNYPEVGPTVKPATDPLSATSFQEIAESIRASVQAATDSGKISRSTGIVRAAEVIAEIRPAVNAFNERSGLTNRTSVSVDRDFQPVPEQIRKMPVDVDVTSVLSFLDSPEPVSAELKMAPAFDPSDLSRRDLSDVTYDTNPMENDNAAIVDKKPIGQQIDMARVDELWQQQQPVNPKQIEAQVSPHLLELAALAARKNEKQSLKMRLNPAELGSVEIRLERSDNGQLNAFFRTESDTAHHALSQNMESLRETLQNAGWQVGQFEVSTGGGSSTAHQNPGHEDRGAESYANFEYERGGDNSEPTQSDNSDRLLSLLA